MYLQELSNIRNYSETSLIGLPFGPKIFAPIQEWSNYRGIFTWGSIEDGFWNSGPIERLVRLEGVSLYIAESDSKIKIQ